MRAGLIASFIILMLIAGFILGKGIVRLPKRKSTLLLAVGFLFSAAGVLSYSLLLRPIPTPPPSPPSRYGAYGTSAYQFELGSRRIPRASVWEPRKQAVSVPDALEYLDMGADIWNQKYKCVACHTTGIYLMTRPAISSLAGPPPESVRRFAVESMTRYLNDTSEKVLSLGHRSAQVVYTAAGLTAWDTELRGRLSPETDQVLRLMFRLQQDNGTWKIPRNWPPLQSSPYQLATVAALAVATAQGWNGPSDDPSLRDQIGDLKSYLNETSPPHDYSRVWLLWAGSNLDGILPSDRKASILETIWNRQNEDGGWSLRSFAAPGDWGDGSRKANLEAEGDINSPASDGHMTGLVVVALREAGVPATDPRIQRAVSWMDSSQRISGRWWTQSLNSNKYHLITYSGTCFVLLSLWKCNALARPEP